MIAVICLEPPRPGACARAAEGLIRRLTGTDERIAVVVGGSSDSETLRWALERRTFTRLLHIDDPALERADHFTLGMVLAEVARQVGAGLVVAGEIGEEEGQGLVPAAIAQQWQAPLVAHVCEMVASTDGTLEVIVPSGGRLCTFGAACPVVLAAMAGGEEDASPDAPEPATSVEAMNLTQLGIDSSRLVPRPELLGMHASAPSSQPRSMSPDEAARLLLRKS